MDYPSGMRPGSGSLRHRQDGQQQFLRFVGDLAELLLRRIGQLRHVRLRQFLFQQPEQFQFIQQPQQLIRLDSAIFGLIVV